MSTRNVNEITEAVAFNARLTRMQARDALLAIGTVITNEVAHGHAVELPGFGLFDLGTYPDEKRTRALRFRQHAKVREVLNEKR